MYNLHMMAHQRYEEHILEAERQAQFVVECNMRASEECLVVAGESSHPLRRLFDLARQFRRVPALRRA